MLFLLKEITALQITPTFFLLVAGNTSFLLVDMFVLGLALAKMKTHCVTLSSIIYTK